MREIKKNIFEELKTGRTDLYASFVEENPGFKLYKYRSGNSRDIDVLKHGKLWMGCAANMDDVYDCGFQTAENWPLLYLLICGREPKFAQEKYAKPMIAGGKVFQKGAYVCSLSETSTNEDLWIRYAAGHHGFCIEYSICSLIEKRLVPLPVIYGEIEKSIMDFAENNNSLYLDVILRKDEKKWGKQDEWRIFFQHSDLGLQPGDAGKLIEAPRPTAIICGKFAPKELTESLRQLATSLGVPLMEEVQTSLK